MKEFVCASINYKRCDEDFRGKLAFEIQKQEDFIKENRNISPVLLCTCCRTEIYFMGNADSAAGYLSALSGISENQINRNIMLFSGEGAIRHLFRVASGMDSMVIGEDEILGQLKSAYAFASEKIHLSHDVNMIFQCAVSVAKRIKTETAISKTSVSYATLAAKLAAHFADNVKVMLIGAGGQLGTSLLKNLLSYKNVSVIATMRSHSVNAAIIPETAALEVLPYASRYERIGECDCIISATSSPHFVITADEIKSVPEKKQLYIDLAVPRDIDPSVADMENIRLCNIDYFREFAENNNLRKQDSVEQAKLMIEEEIDELKKQLLFHDLFPEFKKAALSEMTGEELFLKLKSKLSFSAFRETADAVINIGGK